MFRKVIYTTCMICICAAPYALAPNAQTFKSFRDKISSAESFSASYVVQVLGGSQSSYSVELQKPNKARLDLPQQLIVADGQKVTYYNKRSKKYYLKDQSDSLLKGMFATDELQLWAPFFDGNALSGVTASPQGTVNRKGKELDVVKANIDPTQKRLMTIYLDPSTLAAHSAALDFVELGTPKTKIFTFDKYAFGANLGSVFVFNAPAGAEKIEEADLNAAQWLTDFDQAMQIAQASGKIVFVDFMADWCHWCHELDKKVFSTQEFKDLSSKMVFCRINIDKEPGLKQKYKVGGIPDCKLVKPDGTVKASIVGFMEANAYIQRLKKELQ